jgi:glycine oxidase
MSDFYIIGAGINGLLVARELASMDASVTVFDKGECGKEASWAGGGIVSPLYPWRYPPEITALASLAQAFYPALADALINETGIDPEYEQTGLLMLDAGDEADAVQWGKQFNKTMSKVDVAAVYDQEPRLAPGFQTALSMPGVANVRNPRLCQALVSSLKAMPTVTIAENCPIQHLRISAERIHALATIRHGKLSEIPVGQSQVIVCGGAWSGMLLSNTGYSSDIEPVKGEMLLYKFDAPPINTIVLFDGRYLIPRRDGHLLVGSTLEYSGFDKDVSQAARAILKTAAVNMLPELAEIEPIGQWAGLRPGSKGGIPAIGAVPGIKNLYVNAGQYRNGLVLAPASARLLVDCVLERESPIDLAPYMPKQHSKTTH